MHSFRRISNPFQESKLVKATLIAALVIYVTIGALSSGQIKTSINPDTLDTGIAVSMLWYLTKLCTPLRKTRAMVHRLVRLILQSGTATTMISITTLVVFLVYPPLSVASTAVAGLISHFYSLTLLFNLNLREQIRREGTKVTSIRNYNYVENRMGELSGAFLKRTFTFHSSSVLRHRAT